MPDDDTILIQNEFNYTSRPTELVAINEDIAALINSVSINLLKIKLAEKETTKKNKIQAQIDKIKSLKFILISLDSGIKKPYYSIADHAGGVTQKTCLVDEENLKNKLAALEAAQKYEDIENNKITINAILKHPKAGKDTEVQREAIGLKIARILGFKQVTTSLLVSHQIGSERRPCLFVPFDQIELLTPYIDQVDSWHGRLKEEQFRAVEDLGKYSTYFMLSGDPDCIGKNAQNKGLASAEPSKLKILYIFDQVFMPNNNFGLDRAFNLVPTNFLSKLPNYIARHFMGRNKSIINDSSYEEKINSSLTVLAHQDNIKQLFKAIETRPTIGLKTPTEERIINGLKRDAPACLKSFNARIQNIKKLFPPIKINNEAKQIADLVKNDDKENLDLLRKSMLLNQLLNKPKLFDKAGKPYRAPFFCSLSTHVKQVSIEENRVNICFERRFGCPISESKRTLLKQHGFIIARDGKSASILKETLLKLNEQEFFKEQAHSIDLAHDYLSLQKMTMIAKTYHEDSKRLLKIISGIKNAENKLMKLQSEIKKIEQIQVKNKGFLKHVKQCFLYEAMKEIIKLDTDQKNNLEQGFIEAKNQGNLEDYVTKQLSDIIGKQQAQHRLTFSQSIQNIKGNEAEDIKINIRPPNV